MTRISQTPICNDCIKNNHRLESCEHYGFTEDDYKKLDFKYDEKLQVHFCTSHEDVPCKTCLISAYRACRVCGMPWCTDCFENNKDYFLCQNCWYIECTYHRKCKNCVRSNSFVCKIHRKGKFKYKRMKKTFFCRNCKNGYTKKE